LKKNEEWVFDECSMNELMHQQVYNFTIVKLCVVIVCLEKKHI